MNPNLHRRIVALARRQHGNVTRQQLLRLGLGEEAIKYQVRIGLLFRVHRGVYAVGRPPTTALEKAAAAVLACGPGAALSHRAALALWGYTDRWPSWCDVTVPRDCRRSGIAVHRTASLQRWDVRIHQGIRVTSPAWTLVDCAPDLSDRAQARAVNQALRSKHLKRWQLAELIERRKNRPATGRLHRFVADTGGPTRSELEDTFLEFCERYGLPQPRTNTIVAGREADAYFDAEKLIVELDSWEFHSSRESFEDDRDRDANALAAGIGTVRVTWERMIGNADREAGRLRQILEARR